MTAAPGVLAATRLKPEDIEDTEDDTQAGGLIPFPGALQASLDLGFDVDSQEQTHWCWAAVAVSVARHFDSATPWLQCALVNAELQQTSCCEEGGSPSCNVDGYLDLALKRVAHFRAMRTGVIDFSEALSEIGASRPRCARIVWTEGGGHFVVVLGVRQTGDNRVLRIGDPWHGTVEEGWTEPPTPYLGDGSWTHKYFTQP
jgi:hypothetical protein